jgi:hypothetical protein
MPSLEVVINDSITQANVRAERMEALLEKILEKLG